MKKGLKLSIHPLDDLPEANEWMRDLTKKGLKPQDKRDPAGPFVARMNERPDEEGIMGFVGFIELTGFVESWVCGAQ